MPVPPGVVTLTKPVEPLPTVAEIRDGPFTMKDAAGVPPKLTAVAPVKFVPDIVTTVPVLPVSGANEFITGAGGI